MLLPRPGQPSGASSARGTGSLSFDLLGQSARRLGVLTLLYAFTFFMAGFFPNLLNPVDRVRMFEHPAHWAPGVISIAIALSVWAFTRRPGVQLSTVMNVGLTFEVVSSYGIAIAEYHDPMRLDMGGWMGLSWVAVWTLLFAVVIPTRPLKAGLVTLAAASAPPVVIGQMILTGRTTFNPGAWVFFFWIVFPYLLVTLMTYIGARIIYSLGRAVTEARELGSYRLVERLGGGGMGEVWRAQHRLLARPAAVKLIRPPDTGVSSEEAIRRFEREAQVTAGLTSPHTVNLFDFGVADDGSFYYVMELLEGVDLERLVQRHGPLPAARVIYLLRQVCHSLAEAEAHGLVHRDIKPANLYLCRYGGEHDFIKVLDFGIVKETHEVMKTGALELTRGNVLHGTPGYIAPEQALGGLVDGRADLYATGCVAYYLLTGGPVFAGDTVMAVVVHHAHTPPMPLAERSQLPIPAELDAILMACLAKDPAKRPQTATELSRRLREVPLGEPWTDDRAREWWEAHYPRAARARTG